MKQNNIQLFNAVTGLLFSELYEVFPMSLKIDCDSFGLEEFIDKDDCEGAWELPIFVESTVAWLSSAEYIWLQPRQSMDDHPSATLTSKGLEVLKACPKSLDITEPLGVRLKKAVAQQSKVGVQEIVSQAISLGFTLVTQNAQHVA